MYSAHLGNFNLSQNNDHSNDTYNYRGSDLRPQKSRTRYDLRKFFLTNRVVNMWNSLPNEMLFKLNLITHFNQDWINFGSTRKYFTITMP